MPRLLNGEVPSNKGKGLKTGAIYYKGPLPLRSFVIYYLGMSVDRQKLAAIHIVKKELGLSDEEYRNILWNVARVKSAKDLSEFQFRKLMNYWVRDRSYRINPYGLTLRQKLYIQYLVRDIGWDENHLSNFLKKYYQKAFVDGLTRKEAVKVIEALKNIRFRQKKAA